MGGFGCCKAKRSAPVCQLERISPRLNWAILHEPYQFEDCRHTPRAVLGGGFLIEVTARHTRVVLDLSLDVVDGVQRIHRGRVTVSLSEILGTHVPNGDIKLSWA